MKPKTGSFSSLRFDLWCHVSLSRCDPHHYLISVGALNAFKAVKVWWEENVLDLLNGVPSESKPEWKISRVDLAADLAGVDLRASDLELFVTPARFKREHHGPEIATGNHRGRRFTGFEFGKRGAGLFARIYDKTVEAEEKAPVREVWSKHGYRPEEHGSTVWRVEFEIRSKLLRDLVRQEESEDEEEESEDKKDDTEDGEDSRRLNSDPAETLREDLDDLWRLAVQEWLVLKSRTGATRAARRSVRDWWGLLATIDRKLGLPGPPGTELSRQSAVSEDPQLFLESSLRSLASYALVEKTHEFSDCLRDLKDFHENSGRQTTGILSTDCPRGVPARSRAIVLSRGDHAPR